MAAAGIAQPWRCLTDPDAYHVELPLTTGEHSRVIAELRGLPAGSTVVLTGSMPGASRSLRRLVHDARIEILGRFLAVRSLEPPTYYVADTPSAMRLFLSDLATVPRGGPITAALFRAWKDASRFGAGRGLRLLARRRLFLARTPSAMPTSASRSGLLAVAGMDSIVLALSKDPNAKLTVLLLPHGSSKPSFAVKVPTTPAARLVVSTERSVFEELRGRVPPYLAATLPRVVVLESAPADALCSAAMPGVPMSASYHSWRHLGSRDAVRADFAAVERWLGSFQAATSGDAAPCDFGEGLEPATTARFGGDEGSAALRAIGRRLKEMRLPRTAVHGDFWFGNLLVEGGEISGVVDWESAALSGDPLRDLARFALSYALYLDRHSRPGHSVSGHPGLIAGEWGAGIVYAVDGRGWFAELFRDFLAGGLARLGGDPGAWRDVALAGIADVAATADHPEFARQHWELFKRLAG